MGHCGNRLQIKEKKKEKNILCMALLGVGGGSVGLFKLCCCFKSSLRPVKAFQLVILAADTHTHTHTDVYG